MKIIIIKALSQSYLNKCLSSLKKTAFNISKEDIFVIKEKKFREVTLNYILKKFGKDDLFIISDDIIFTKGWYQNLQNKREKTDILGFSMLYPGTKIIQDYGYDLVKIDNKITLNPLYRGKKIKDLRLSPLRFVDSINGCAMFIKKEVIEIVGSVPLEGQNRWGEFLFCYQAQKQGFKVAVSSHHLYHYGLSTKAKKNNLSSTSWLIEREIWQKICCLYIDESKIEKKIIIHIDKALLSLLKTNCYILFYGSGKVAEKLVRFVNHKNFVVCSGLKEEAGKYFCDKKIIHIDDVDLKKFQVILITPLYLGEKIFKSVLEGRISSTNEVFWINAVLNNDCITYSAVIAK
jgi:hypothetical protein